MTDEVKQPAVVVRLQRPVRPADGVVLDAEGWPVLTHRGSEDAQIKYRGGQRVYSQDALDAAVAAERERCAAWVDARRDAFCEEQGSIDPDTGALEFGRGAHAEAKSEYVGELEEIAAGLRALRA